MDPYDTVSFKVLHIFFHTESDIPESWFSCSCQYVTSKHFTEICQTHRIWLLKVSCDKLES